MVKGYLLRLLRTVFGLSLCGLGCYASVQANVGLAPWDALAMGFVNVTGSTYGNMTVAIGVAILVIDFLLHEKIGLGTIMNTLLVGKFADLYAGVSLLPRMEHLLPGVLMLLCGQLVMCVGMYFYASAGLGCGPRDSLMVGLGRRLPRLPIGLVRGVTEAAALLCGWLLGAKIGVGTVIAVFGISFLMQGVFALFRFDVKAVRHEDLLDTLRILTGKKQPEKAEKALTGAE